MDKPKRLQEIKKKVQSNNQLWTISKGSLKSYSDRNVKVQGTKALQYIAVSQIPNYQTRFPKAKRYRTSIRVGIHRMRGGGKTNSEVEVRDEYSTAHGGKFIPPQWDQHGFPMDFQEWNL